LRALQSKYGDRVAFVFVYVAEAPHTYHLKGPLKQHYPEAPVEIRQQIIRDILEEMKFPFQCLFDRDDRQIEKTYHAWPQRMLVLRSNGDVAFDAGQGFFSPWNYAEVEGHLNACLNGMDLH
jgi:hypothetical protein